MITNSHLLILLLYAFYCISLGAIDIEKSDRGSLQIYFHPHQQDEAEHMAGKILADNSNVIIPLFAESIATHEFGSPDLIMKIANEQIDFKILVQKEYFPKPAEKLESMSPARYNCASKNSDFQDSVVISNFSGIFSKPIRNPIVVHFLVHAWPDSCEGFDLRPITQEFTAAYVAGIFIMFWPDENRLSEEDKIALKQWESPLYWVTEKKLTVHLSPNEQSDRIFDLKKGEKILFLEKTALFSKKSNREAAWYKVRDKVGREGYVWSGAITNDSKKLKK